MAYYRLGYISRHGYNSMKHTVKKLLIQEMFKRDLFPSKDAYVHQRPDDIGEIWAQDITTITVESASFKVALLIDTFDQYLLGVEFAKRESVKLIESPVQQALTFNKGLPPKKFLLSDNGKVYVSDAHGNLLDSSEIIHKRIPPCKPQYNGAVECGGKEFKNVFYNVWAEYQNNTADKEKSIEDRVRIAINATAKRLNHEIPRPALKGVTPADVHNRIAKYKILANCKYIEQERKRKNIPPWKKNYWNMVKDTLDLKNLTKLEVMTKFLFFCLKPLRKISKIQSEGVG